MIGWKPFSRYVGVSIVALLMLAAGCEMRQEDAEPACRVTAVARDRCVYGQFAALAARSRAAGTTRAVPRRGGLSD